MTILFDIAQVKEIAVSTEHGELHSSFFAEPLPASPVKETSSSTKRSCGSKKICTSKEKKSSQKRKSRKKCEKVGNKSLTDFFEFKSARQLLADRKASELCATTSKHNGRHTRDIIPSPESQVTVIMPDTGTNINSTETVELRDKMENTGYSKSRNYCDMNNLLTITNQSACGEFRETPLVDHYCGNTETVATVSKMDACMVNDESNAFKCIEKPVDGFSKNVDNQNKDGNNLLDENCISILLEERWECADSTKTCKPAINMNGMNAAAAATNSKMLKSDEDLDKVGITSKQAMHNRSEDSTAKPSNDGSKIIAEDLKKVSLKYLNY